MIELAMVRSMARRALLVAPVVVIALAAWGGPKWGLSAAVGLAMTLANLGLAGLLIGRVADHNPQFLMAAGMMSFGLGLAVLAFAAIAIRDLDIVYFPVTGYVLIAGHLGLVLWEASSAYERTGRVD